MYLLRVVYFIKYLKVLICYFDKFLFLIYVIFMVYFFDLRQVESYFEGF